MRMILIIIWVYKYLYIFMMIMDNVFVSNEFDTQYGIKIACVNVNGFATNKDKRMDLSIWMQKHQIDVCCIQEWHKQNENNNNNNNSNIYKYILNEIESEFDGYKAHINNKKCLIIYNKIFKVDDIELNCEQEGLNSTWIAMHHKNNILVIGSIYYSPSYDCDINELSKHMKNISKRYNKKNVYFSINGDFNARHCDWAKKTDARGINIKGWCIESGLNILNKGRIHLGILAQRKWMLLIYH